jgi:hypothetical protein
MRILNFPGIFSLGVTFTITLTTTVISSSQAAHAQTFDTSSIGASAAQAQPIPVNTPGAKYLNLTVVSTGSVDLNSVDMPFLRSNGGGGAFPSDAGTDGSSSTAGNSGAGASGGSQTANDPPQN